jgi:hypothetical protein
VWLLRPIDDSAVENAETVTITAAAGVAYVVGTPASASVSILDNDAAAVVSITATDANASESGDAGQFTVTRAGSTAGSLSVNLSISGTATAGADYTTLPQA